MFNHVVEFVGLLRMALFHRGNDVHHPSARLGGSQMAAGSEKDEFGYVAVVEAYAPAVWPAIFTNLKPNDVCLVFKAPSFHRLETPRKESIRAP
jgi:hypothetical protein